MRRWMDNAHEVANQTIVFNVNSPVLQVPDDVSANTTTSFAKLAGVDDVVDYSELGRQLEAVLSSPRLARFVEGASVGDRFIFLVSIV